MRRRAIFWGLFVLAVGAVAGVQVWRLASVQPPNEVEEQREIRASELPGTIEDNAAKAYRMLFQDIAQEAGAVDPNAYKSASMIKSDPVRYIAHADRLVEISLIEHADWGVERNIGSLVPHVSEMGALDTLLAAKVDALAGSGDGEGIGELLAARVRLAQHLAQGWSLIEWVTAERILRSAFDQIEAHAELIRNSDRGFGEVFTAINAIEGQDPLGAKDAVRSDMVIVAQGAREGFFARYGDSDTENLKGRMGRRVARQIEELIPQIMDAWDAGSVSQNLIKGHLAAFESESGYRLLSDYADVRRRAESLNFARHFVMIKLHD